MLVLGLDYETTALEPKNALVIEIGMALWSPDQGRIMRQQSLMVDHPEITELNEAITEETGITLEMLREYGVEPEKAFKLLYSWMKQADVVLAHNGNSYDRNVWRAWCERNGADPMDEKIWVDTMVDKPWPKKWNKQLTCLAAYHGFLNPFPHQALFDVATLIRVVSPYDFDEMVKYAQIPMIKIEALVDFEHKDLAKNRGYWFEKTPRKRWVKEIKECHLQEELDGAKEAGFKMVVLA